MISVLSGHSPRHSPWDQIQRLNSKINQILFLFGVLKWAQIRSHSSGWESQCILWLFSEWIPYVDTMGVELHLVTVFRECCWNSDFAVYYRLIYQCLPMWEPERNLEVCLLRSHSADRHPVHIVRASPVGQTGKCSTHLDKEDLEWGPESSWETRSSKNMVKEERYWDQVWINLEPDSTSRGIPRFWVYFLSSLSSCFPSGRV